MYIGVVQYICYDYRQSKNICYLFCELLNVKKWAFIVILPNLNPSYPNTLVVSRGGLNSELDHQKQTAASR